MNGRWGRRIPGLRRRLALATATVMVGTLLQATAAPTVAADDGKGRPALPKAERPIEGAAVKGKPRKLMKGPRTPKAAPKASWPTSESAVATLPAAQKRPGRSVKADGLPLSLQPRAKSVKGGAAAGGVKARVLSRKAARKAGVDGVLFTLQPEKSATTGAVGTTLDYSGFAESFGGGYGSRLTLVELPRCALTTPSKEKCRTGEPVKTVNDPEKQTLTAGSVQLRESAPTVLAAVASSGSADSDYGATQLSPSAAWQTNLNTGDFTWSYAMPVPDVPGGLQPKVDLSYSSGAIDGRTGNTNNQSSWIGDGFDLWPGFIERRYKPCADDGIKHGDGRKPGDQCWAYDNAFISFNGKAGELVPAGDGEWKLKQDDGTRIKHLTSTNRGNGDNNGEYWRLTTPEGTRYYFGYNRLPGWADGKATTESTWTVPVFGDDSGEPCHADTFAGSWCQQAWRWNLDYVVDTHSNAVAYYYNKEQNSYGRDLKASDNTRYTRGGYLGRIEYGLKSSSMYGTKALAKVTFGNAERCLPDANTTCSDIDTDSAYWYDTPWDLNCTADEDCDEGRFAPTFWTRKRLTNVTTHLLKADGAYGAVDSWKLTHRWGQADVDYQLLLASLQHTGQATEPAITLPKTTFAYTQLENRLDKTGDGYAPFIKARLSTVADESGGQIDVNYSAPACSWEAPPTPETNTTRCYPQYIGGSDTTDPERQWFNKYVVNSVTETDRTGGAPDKVTAYDYLGGAAWHYDDDDGLTKEKFKTWSQWRGYGHVRTLTGGQGGSSAMKSQQDTYFLRGMDGDRKSTSGGTKDVTVSLGTGEGDPITDHESTAGFTYKTVSFSGPGGKVLSKTVSRPWHHETAKKVRDWGTVTANFTGSSSSKSWTSLDDGAGDKWRTTSTAAQYDTVAGRVVQADDFGDNSTAADNRCTRTTYATNATKNILTLASRRETVSVSCASTPDRSKDVIEDTRTGYDGGAYDAAPTKGDPTAVAQLKKHDGTTATYLESGVTFDSYGRKLTATDITATVTVTGSGSPQRTARSDGRTITTAYTPTTGLATSITETTPPANKDDTTTAQQTVTKMDTLRGQPSEVTDTNGNTTKFEYDALGRSTKVWLPDRTTTSGQLPTYQFDYRIEDGKPVAVATRTLSVEGGSQVISYTLYDGFLRTRQTQNPGPDGGRVLTDVFYDERGLRTKEFSAYYAEGKPSRDLFKPIDALGVETQTHYAYDGLGRQFEAKQIAGNGDGGTVLGVTKTIYGGDRTAVIPPEGGVATTTLTDARGNTTELRQHHQRAADAAYDATAYTYSPRGDLTKVQDPAGNTWSYTYDQLGRRTDASDPDKGTTHSEYDDRDQVTYTEDARGIKLYGTYDNLGRRTELREGSATGTLRAKWVYDTVRGAKGQLAEATRYVDGQAYTTKVTLYDRLYRPVRTAVVIPAVEGTLAGTYQSGTAYKPSGAIGAVSYSAAGSLPGGSYSYTYEAETQRPIAMLGDGFQTTTAYSLTGKPLQHELGDTSGGRKTWATNTYEWGTQRLATSRVDRQDVAGVDQYYTYGYDQAGNVQSLSDVSRSGTDTQCFAYDYLRRLTQAWTQPVKTCAAEPTASVTGGPASYWTSYTYDKGGNRLTETQHDTGGDSTKDVKRTYDYPDPGQPQPHALTSVTTQGPTGSAKDTYHYDEAGNTDTRTLGGDAQKLTWDAEGRLTKVTEPAAGGGEQATEYLYDADGNRLIGRTPTETTLYLGGTEITVAKGADEAKATRYIDLGNGHQAVQEDNGSTSFTIADHHGTGQLAVDAATLELNQRRTTPFGDTRGQEPTDWPGTKGFVGGTTDESTGLTHLDAREYDPTTGRFISVDPVMDPADPQQFNAYAYANNNPLTFSDPDGLRCIHGAPGGGKDGICAGVAGDTDGVINGYSNNCSRTMHCYETAVKMARHAKKIGSYGKTPVQYKKWLSDGAKAREQYRCGLFGCAAEANPAAWCYRNAVICTAFEVARQVTPVMEKGWEVTKDLTGIGSFEDCKSGDLEACVDLTIDMTVASKVKLLKRAIGFCHSFVPGTDVLLADGTAKNIEDVEIGDKIVVTDPETGRTVTREVVGTIVTEDDKEFVDLTVAADEGKNDASLISTTTHPFWSPSEGKWVNAGDLKPGMTLRTSKGDTAKVTDVRHFTKRQRTHDLTVNEIHTYYVLAGAHPVLVHNCNGRDPVNDGLDDDTYERIDGAHGPDVADGVDYQVQRMHDGSSTAADHDLPGIGHDPDALASYFASWRGKMTHTDTRTGSRVAYDSSRGVLIVTTGRNIHGFRYSQDAFESGRYVTP